MKVLSIRQPWAWLIVNGHKDIENRDWPTKYRGPVLIHASKGMTRDEYEDVAEYVWLHREIRVPEVYQLDRGGIVGIAEVIDCVDASGSPWFFGHYGFVLANARPLPFYPLRGQLGFFPAPADYRVPAIGGAA